MSGAGEGHRGSGQGESVGGESVGGESDLAVLLAGMTPRLRPGRYVFATVPDGRWVPGAVVTVAEDEGTTVVVPAEAAGGLDAEYPCAWITLEVRSSLVAVGFLATVCSRLAEVGISVNPVSGFHHDHLFVPWDRREEAMAVLERERLAGGAS